MQKTFHLSMVIILMALIVNVLQYWHTCSITNWESVAMHTSETGIKLEANLSTGHQIAKL